MEEQILIGDRVVIAGADGRPERLVEVVAVISRAEGSSYEVRVPGAKRKHVVEASEVFRLRAPTS